jgi:predicted Zn-ribbon and HTH transcriptional regulator
MDWVREILKKYNLDEAFDRQQVLLLWEEMIGPNLSLLTHALRFSRGTLWVETASPALAHELSFLKERYIAKLNEYFDEPILREIRFVPGHFARTPLRKKVFLPPEERASAHTLFSHLPDSHLSHSFERLYLTQRRREEALLAAGGRRCPRCGVVFCSPGKICPGCLFDEIEDPGRND